METKGRVTPTFFLDRTHGKRTSRILQSVGVSVVLHHKWFHHTTPDPEWIAKCGEQGWVVLSGDKSIEIVPENREAVIEAKCKVFFFKDSNSFPEEWAAAVLVGRPRLYEIIERNDGPFFVTIDKVARGHISTVRFAGSGGPRPLEPEVVGAAISTPTPADRTPAERTSVQQNLFSPKPER